ncbi:hypothetical protein [Mycobacteroides abscessus]|uniref:hypothetical protein n=1 Tax=Mycobacteroides abscessus TaxID=36809 RepID=UPI0002683461|nr:hypothetical protein [Mycobacteroides abscessus]EIT90880.1 hypothetical protein MA4S0303_4685 [Mycobacteroides abscessus 4S-0303]EIT92879.1 hypothetical protein MA4S0726RB_4215 [Mycobacteroides abscessus 4S-0726-RB]EIT96424.1 hypothetical protein MA4S0726RA_4621 [Mycobacteroides abscessus 4S-0726-RA]EIV60858.1 hypothetical protein MA4S0116S_3760 [Mycobacteroides abscessus 4S-0116-S]
MTYTAVTWTTTSVGRIKADYVAVYHKPDGDLGTREANMVLTQMNDTGDRRSILGVIDTNTCEVIAAPDMPGFIELVDAAVWRARGSTLTLIYKRENA